MKRLRKTAMAAALAVSMMCGGFSPVFAVDSPTQTQSGNVTVTEVVEGLNYQAYQLFTGTFSKTPTTITDGLKNGSVSHELAKDENDKGLNTMGDVAFGTAAGDKGQSLISWINEYMTKVIKKADYNFDPKDDPKDNNGITKAQLTADEIGSQPELQTVDFANYVGMKIKQSTTAVPEAAKVAPTVQDDGTYDAVFNDLTSGYYLIMAETPAAPTPSEGATLAQTSAIMVPVAGDIEIHSKTSKPTVDKQVTDKTDGTGWDSAASVGLIKPNKDGDLELNGLSYKLTGNISSNVIDFAGANHGTYKYEFIDTLPIGVKLDDGDKLPANWTQNVYLLRTINGTETKFNITGQSDAKVQPKIKTVNGGEGKQSTITWTWDNLLDVLAATGWDYGYSNAKNISVVVEYTPVYTEDQIKAIFNAQSQTTDPQTNTVYVQFSNNPHNKGDLDRTPDDITRVYSFNLNLKKVDGDNKALNGAEFTLKDSNGKEAGKLIIKDGKVYPEGEDITEVPAEGQAQFTWTGLDADTEYTLAETKVPTGYKKIEDIKFTIKPIFKVDPNGNKELESVEAVVTQGTANSINKVGGTWMIDASLSGDVVNVQGPNMPITGQAGIWTGVAAGGAVIAISAYAVLKKKKEQE